MKDAYIGIDIGGTYIKGVLIEETDVKYKTTVKTNDHHGQWQQAASEVLEEIISNSGVPIKCVGLAAPGLTDDENRSISCMPGRLEGLEQFDWSGFFRQDVHVLNDAHAALVSESRWGVAADISNVVMLTLGTGIGGGLLINGQLQQGFLHRAGHLGHISIDSANEYRDITGISGSLEDAVGEATLTQRSLGKFSSSRDLVMAYLDGDTWATYVWLTTVRKLALGIVSVCNIISPDVVVLAGGITKAKEHLLEPLSAFLDLYEWRPGGHATPIKLAKFEEFAGAIGAALFAQSQTAAP